MSIKHRKMKGGFLDNIGKSLSSAWTNTAQAATNAFDYTKKKTTEGYNFVTGTPKSTGTISSTGIMGFNNPTPKYGGKNRTKKIRGGFKDNISMTNLASHSASFSGKTAQPHNWVGGKSKKRHYKKNCSKKHYKKNRSKKTL